MTALSARSPAPPVPVPAPFDPDRTGACALCAGESQLADGLCPRCDGLVW